MAVCLDHPVSVICCTVALDHVKKRKKEGLPVTFPEIGHRGEIVAPAFNFETTR